MNDNKKKNEDKVYIKGSLDDVLKASSMDINKFTGLPRMIIDIQKEQIGESNYKNWSVATYSSFNDFRSIADKLFVKDSFKPYDCYSSDAKRLYKYFTSKGMFAANNGEVEEPRGIVFVERL